MEKPTKSADTGNQEKQNELIIKELWEKRNEMSKDEFWLLIESLQKADTTDPQSDISSTCPISGEQVDTIMYGSYGSLIDGDVIYMHHSVAKDLVNLAYRVGAGMAGITIEKIQKNTFKKTREILFDHNPYGMNNEGELDDIVIRIINTIGALDEKDVGFPFDYKEEMQRSDLTLIMQGDKFTGVKIITPESIQVFGEARERVSEALE